MTTINATEGVARVHINASQIHDSHTFIYFVESSAFAHVPTADLLAALDATANTDVADKCLAYAANVAESRDEWKACAERWAESKESWKADAAEWQTRAEKAEAAVERVRELAERWRTPELLAALDPKPAFTLPTEAGVRFTAKRTGWPDDASEFVTLSDGNGKAFYFIPDDPDGYTDEESRIWPAEGVMSKWTDHRLIGAES